MSKAQPYRQRTPQENYAIKSKADELIAQGMDTQRAVAAAFRMYRDGELKYEIATAPKLTQSQQLQRQDMKRRRTMATEPGAVIIDAAALLGFTKLIRNLHKKIK